MGKYKQADWAKRMNKPDMQKLLMSWQHKVKTNDDKEKVTKYALLGWLLQRLVDGYDDLDKGDKGDKGKEEINLSQIEVAHSMRRGHRMIRGNYNKKESNYTLFSVLFVFGLFAGYYAAKNKEEKHYF